MKRISPILCAALAMLATSCAAPSATTRQSEASSSSSSSSSDRQANLVTVGQMSELRANPTPAARSDRDARPTPRKLYQLEFLELSVPRGTLSDNAEFWKYVDEEVLGLATHDLLDKNGLRVGVANRSDLSRLDEYLTDARSTQRRLVGTSADDMRIELRTGIDRQTLFYFNRRGELVGEDFERVDNLLLLNFRQAPRNPDMIRLTLAPAVRARQAKLQLGARGVETVREQSIYDLGISLTLPVDQVLIICPSMQSGMNVSVGRQFFVEETPTQLMERVLVIVPSVKGTIEETTAQR